MRLTWLSNAPWTPYSYGQQAAIFTPRLVKKGHEVGIIANFGHQGNPLNWNGVQVFGSSFHPWCMDVMHSHSITFRADALVTMFDLQVMDPNALMGTKWIPWTPVDHETMPPEVANKLPYALHVLTMSKHASKQMEAAGVEYDYIPCGVDTKIFKLGNMFEAREKMRFPQGKFVVGMVAANKGLRKAFHQNIMAFAALQKKHGDCALYLHTHDGTRSNGDQSDLTAFLRAIGLTYGYSGADGSQDKDVLFADQYTLALGYDSQVMADIYSSMDVYLGVTMGEGFGIPLIEAQACGTPVIVGDWTAMPELVSSGWKVDKKDAEPIFTSMNAFQFLPRPAAIADKLEAAYQMRGNPDYRKRAVAGGQLYDADRIVERNWLPFLKKMEEKLQEKQPTRLDTNLSMLRSVPA